jgi:hypothetical protein
MNNALKAWMTAASTTEQEELARRVGTSRMYLYTLANPSAKYGREPRPELAIKIEHASRDMHRESKKRLPMVLRTDLNSHCRGCHFAQKCLSNAQYFDIIDESTGEA